MKVVDAWIDACAPPFLQDLLGRHFKIDASLPPFLQDLFGRHFKLHSRLISHLVCSPSLGAQPQMWRGPAYAWEDCALCWSSASAASQSFDLVLLRLKSPQALHICML